MIVLNVEKGTTGKIVILEKPYFSWDLGVRFFYMKKLYYSRPGSKWVAKLIERKWKETNQTYESWHLLLHPSPTLNKHLSDNATACFWSSSSASEA